MFDIVFINKISTLFMNNPAYLAGIHFILASLMPS
jgi:hypothetical protein